MNVAAERLRFFVLPPGKTTWTQDLLSKLYQFFPDGGYVFTRTKMNKYWAQHFPENRIYPGFDVDVISKILEEQRMKYEKIAMGENKDEDGEPKIPYICMIFDDVISDKQMRYEELMNEIVFSGRHYFCFIVVCTQDVKGMLCHFLCQNA